MIENKDIDKSEIRLVINIECEKIPIKKDYFM